MGEPLRVTTVLEKSVYFIISVIIYMYLGFEGNISVLIIPVPGHCSSSHYANTPMQYTAIFHGCKNVHFQMIF